MADAIGILGFVLHVAHRIYDVVEKIRDAPQEIRELQREASRVRTLLSLLRDTLTSDEEKDPKADDNEDALHVLSDEANELVRQAEQFLGKVTKSASQDAEHLDVHKVKWSFYAARGKQLAEKFRGFYLSLCALHSIRMSHNFISAASEVRQLERQINARFDALASNSHDLSSIQTAQLVELSTIRSMVERSMRRVSSDQRVGRSLLFEEVTRSYCSQDSSSSLGNPEKGLAVPDSSSAGRSPLCYVRAVDRFPVTGRRLRCLGGCRCRCHYQSTIRPIPKWLASWVGDLYLPRALLSSVWSSLVECDEQTCRRNWINLMTIRYFLPSWFVSIEAKIRFEALPVCICIQTPRVVESLSLLYDASIEDMRTMLSTRQLTINDVDTSGLSIMHHMMRLLVMGDPTSLDPTANIKFLLDSGAPSEWEHKGFTPLELSLYAFQSRLLLPGRGYSQWTRRNVSKEQLGLFQANVAGPLFNEDVYTAWDNIQSKAGWTELHRLFIGLEEPSFSLDELASVLRSSTVEVNALDVFNKPALFYALRAYPQAVDTLLSVGADPKLVPACIVDAIYNGATTAISPLIRAGIDVNERSKGGSHPLHILAIGMTPNCYEVALELVRHGGHALDWDAQNDSGHTAFDFAQFRWKNDPLRSDMKKIFELIQTRKWQVSDNKDDYTSSASSDQSLIVAGLLGNTDSISAAVNGGASINARDNEGRTLLHLVAMGQVVNGCKVALEIVRCGGYAVDWDALTPDGNTALTLAQERLSDASDWHLRKEAENIVRLLKARRLPIGKHYVYPCMDPNYYEDLEAPRMPGSLRS